MGWEWSTSPKTPSCPEGFALKLLPERLVADVQAAERFKREAHAASALNHPNICVVYDVELDAHPKFIAMELLEGETLQTRLLHGPLPVEQVLEIGIQIASALATA